MIHSTAIIDPTAQIAEGVSIGAYSIIGPQVSIGADCQIDHHVVIQSHARLGERNRIYAYASIGQDPQDKKYGGEETWLDIGDDNVIREFVTLNRGTVQDQGITRIGSHNLFMAYVHVAHDCRIGDHVIMANGASLAGHVQVQDWAILGGFSMVHQFTRIGAHAFSGMGSAISKDVPPYILLGGQPAQPHGINSEGLKRRGFSPEQISHIKQAYRLLYRSGLSLEEAIQAIEALKQPELHIMVQFLKQRSRSIIR